MQLEERGRLWTSGISDTSVARWRRRETEDTSSEQVRLDDERVRLFVDCFCLLQPLKQSVITLIMPIAPITGRLRKRLWLDLSMGLGLGISAAYAYW